MKRCVVYIGYLPLSDMAFTGFSFNPGKMFDHNIPFILVFPHNISGEFCTLLSCSENITDGVLKKKKSKQNVKYFLNKTFTFFYQNLLVLFLQSLLGKAALQCPPTALHIPPLLCCTVVIIISFWPWAQSMQPDWRPLTVDSRNWFNISRRGLAHIEYCSNFICSCLCDGVGQWGGGILVCSCPLKEYLFIYF